MHVIGRLTAVAALLAIALLGVALVGTGSAAGQRAAGVQKAKLSAGVARSALAAWLGRRYGEAWYERSGGSIKCNKRVAFNARRCTFIFVIGDTGRTGTARVAHFRGGAGERRAIIKYRVAELDEYCAFVLERPPEKCVSMSQGTARLESF